MSKTVHRSGPSTLGLLGIVFVAFKLCGIIDWSWWWVTLPFWGGLALVFVIFMVLLVAAIISDSK